MKDVIKDFHMTNGIKVPFGESWIPPTNALETQTMNLFHSADWHLSNEFVE